LLRFQKANGIPPQQPSDIGGFVLTTDECSLDGGSPSCTEGNLDIQYIMGVAQRVATTYWYVGGKDPFLDWITAVADMDDPPQVNSMSWGSIEQSVSEATKDQFYIEAAKLAAMGVTVVVSSGDNGVSNFGCHCGGGSAASDNCACQADSSSDSSGWTGDAWSGKGYFPSFPATCPYVTAVGGTMGDGGSVPSSPDDEIACQVIIMIFQFRESDCWWSSQSQSNGIITTGGGFSTYYPRPSWQTSALLAYRNRLTAAPKSGYNSGGRGYPDVSLVAVKYQVVVGGQATDIYGTSASAPVFAAFGTCITS
jgi:tripeptidyl-peptidase-1